MKFKNMLVRYGMGFLILWILGTIIPIVWSTDFEGGLLSAIFMIIFNPVGAILIYAITSMTQTPALLNFMIITIGQIITCIVYKYLLKKLFKIHW